MLRITTQIRGHEALQNLPFKLRSRARIALKAICQNAKQEAQASMKRKEEKMGRVYFYVIAGKKIAHTSAAIGQANAYLTGALSKSITYQVDGMNAEFGYDNSTNYGRKQEIILKRPTLKLALQNTRFQNGMIFQDSVKLNRIFV